MNCSGATKRPLYKMFDAPSFDEAPHQANLVAGYLRRLPLEEMEYTTMPAVAKKLEGRWEPTD